MFHPDRHKENSTRSTFIGNLSNLCAKRVRIYRIKLNNIRWVHHGQLCYDSIFCSKIQPGTV